MILQKGSKGKEVGNWQRFLNSVFGKTITLLKVDNDFGDNTEKYTKMYQHFEDLDKDGKVGKKTINKAIARGFKPMETTKITRPINEIILHITANGNGFTGQKLRDYLDKAHRDRGFDEIGYHGGIDKDGNFIKGRDENKIGAHCKAHGKNHGTIGLFYDARGNDKDPHAPFGKYFQSEKQKLAFIKLVKDKMTEFNISIDNVHGHNFYDAKACPCFDVENDKEFRKAILDA